MFSAAKQVILLIKKTDKIWLLPLLLMFVIIALLVTAAQISPVPVFLYPFI